MEINVLAEVSLCQRGEEFRTMMRGVLPEHPIELHNHKEIAHCS